MDDWESDTLFLADVFKNFKRIRLKIFQLDPVEFFLGLWLAWKADFKNTEVKSELLTEIDMHKIKDQKLQSLINKEAETYQYYLQVKLINMNIFTGEEILPADSSKIIEQAKKYLKNK